MPKMAKETTKAMAAASMSSTIVSRAGGADIHHNCATPLPLPPHRRLVVSGSLTIRLINGLSASRLGDTIVETLEPSPKILAGCGTVLIGG